ncbi:MAG: TonB-dependent receptor [Novosphingobium sp.]
MGQEADTVDAESTSDTWVPDGNAITVTARKREERLIDVPISVTALSGEALEARQINDVTSLVGKTPSLYSSSNLLSPGKDFINLVIRGIGAQSAGTPAVATIVDGVYVPALSFDIGFMDVERVEVLRGPQGTLFGRNTEGGALNIVLRRPDEFARGKVALSYDTFNTVRAQAALSGPLADTIFAAASLDFENSDGYLDNPVLPAQNGLSGTVPADDFRKFSGRLALRFKPTDTLDINVTIDGSDRKGLDGLPGVPRGCDCYDVRSEFQIDARYKNYGGALTVDWDLGFGELTSITGYRKVTSSLPFDFDGSPEFTDNVHDLQTRQSTFSEELRLAGTSFDDQFDWIIGGYLFREKHLQLRRYDLRNILQFPGGITVFNQDQDLKRDGWALFADGTYTLFDKLDLNVGVRYGRETAKSDIVLDFVIYDLLGPGLDYAAAGMATGKLTEDSFTPSASLTYRWSRYFSTYARYARGFRAGGFPLAPADTATNLPFHGEKTENFELGAKANLFGGMLSFDAALYLINLTNQQVSSILFLNGDPDLPVAAVVNAGKSRSKGFEFSSTVRPVNGLTLSADVGYVQAKYREYIDTVGASRAGERFPFVPEWTVNASATYRFPVTDAIDLELFGSYRYVSDILSGSGVDIDVQFPVKGYSIGDIRASLISDPWKLDFFVDNVTDNYVETRVWNAFFFLEPRPFSVLLPPRRAGVRFSYQF